MCSQDPFIFGVNSCYALESMLGRAGRDVCDRRGCIFIVRGEEGFKRLGMWGREKRYVYECLRRVEDATAKGGFTDSSDFSKVDVGAGALKGGDDSVRMRVEDIGDGMVFLGMLTGVCERLAKGVRTTVRNGGRNEVLREAVRGINEGLERRRRTGCGMEFR